MDSKSEFQYTLSQSIKYHSKDGNEQDAFSLTVTAPSSRDRKHTIKIKQSFFRAITSIKSNDSEKKESSGESANIKGHEALMILMMSDQDMEKIYEAFRLILISGSCKLEDGTDFTNVLYEKIQDSDIDNLLADYLEFFFLSFWMKHLSGN